MFIHFFLGSLLVASLVAGSLLNQDIRPGNERYLRCMHSGQHEWQNALRVINGRFAGWGPMVEGLLS